MLEGIRNSTSIQDGRSIRLGSHTSVVESRDSPSSLFHYFELITDKTDKSDKVGKCDKCDKCDTVISLIRSIRLINDTMSASYPDGPCAHEFIAKRQVIKESYLLVIAKPEI